MQHCTVHESLRQPPHIVISLAPKTDLVMAMAPANADAAAILECARGEDRMLGPESGSNGDD